MGDLGQVRIYFLNLSCTRKFIFLGTYIFIYFFRLTVRPLIYFGSGCVEELVLVKVCLQNIVFKITHLLPSKSNIPPLTQ